MILKKTILAGALIALASSPAWALSSATAHPSGRTPPPTATGPTGPTGPHGNNGNGHGVKNRSEAGEEHAGGAQRHGNPNPPGQSNPGHEGNPNPGHNGGNPNRGHKDRNPVPTGPTGPTGPKGHKGHRCLPHAVAYIASGTLVSETLTANAGGTYSGTVNVTIGHTNRHARAVQGHTQAFTAQNVRVRGPLSVQSLAAGDRVKLIGKITALAPKCEAGTFTPSVTIEKLVFHPAH